MLLDISRALRVPMEEFPFLHVERLDEQDVLGETITFDDVTMAGVFSMMGDRLVLKGKLKTVVHAHCANCLAPVDLPLALPFEETFLRKEMALSDDAEDDPDRLAFGGSSVELSHLALTLVVLELPMRFLCKEDCPARAMTLSYDASAPMEEPPRTKPFEVLRGLLVEDENQEE